MDERALGGIGRGLAVAALNRLVDEEVLLFRVLVLVHEVLHILHIRRVLQLVGVVFFLGGGEDFVSVALLELGVGLGAVQT